MFAQRCHGGSAYQPGIRATDVLGRCSARDGLLAVQNRGPRPRRRQCETSSTCGGPVGDPREVCLFHCGLCVAGQADALYRHDDSGDIALVDWKRTKAIRTDSSWLSLREPLQTLPETNGWLYALQLNAPEGVCRRDE